jgi:hydantoinase/carbamoylase family amidase
LFHYLALLINSTRCREGSRFARMCSGSGVWAGEEPLASCHSLVDLTDPETTMASDLKRIGYLGETPCLHVKNPLSAHFELHIEQGPLLEQREKKVAVVSGVQGMRWYEIRCKGAEGHAGATSMDTRADALVPLALFTVKVEELSRREGARGTVGVLTTATKSPNTIPGSSFCTLDLRSTSDATLDKIETELTSYLIQLEKERPGITLVIVRTWKKDAVVFDEVARDCVKSAAVQTVGESLVDELISFAGHDSAETAVVTPTAMIFVPSKDGISHNPSEYTSEEDWYVIIIHIVI